MTVKEKIESKLTKALSPAFLDVVDESHLHKGHAGARPEGETHFRIVIVSDHFEGQSRLQRHRTVQSILKEELDGPVHALAMKIQTPSEHQGE